jgi:phage protein U
MCIQTPNTELSSKRFPRSAKFKLALRRSGNQAKSSKAAANHSSKNI